MCQHLQQDDAGTKNVKGFLMQSGIRLRNAYEQRPHGARLLFRHCQICCGGQSPTWPSSFPSRGRAPCPLSLPITAFRLRFEAKHLEL